MSSFLEVQGRIRRLLRDPDATIWTTEQLFRYWQQAHLELARRVPLLVDARAFPYPTRFDASFMHPWEAQFLEGDLYRCWTHWQAQDEVCMYPWEAAYWMADAGPADDGIRWMHPWEAAFGVSAEPVPFLIHREAGAVRFFVYDQEAIGSKLESEVAAVDGYYQSRSGRPICWYPIEEGERIHALYPQPPIVFDEMSEGDVFDDAGGLILWSDGATESGDTGLTLEAVALEDQLFMVYDVTPLLWNMDDESPYPDPLVHYVECGVLEWAFGADSEGFIPSLRDYWRGRKEAGVEAMKRFLRLSLSDRQTQMGGSKRPRAIKGPSMPDHYPEP